MRSIAVPAKIIAKRKKRCGFLFLNTEYLFTVKMKWVDPDTIEEVVCEEYYRAYEVSDCIDLRLYPLPNGKYTPLKNQAEREWKSKNYK